LNVVVSENHKIVGVAPEGEKNYNTQVAAAEVVVAQGAVQSYIASCCMRSVPRKLHSAILMQYANNSKLSVGTK